MSCSTLMFHWHFQWYFAQYVFTCSVECCLSRISDEPYLLSNLWSISSFEGSFSDGVLDPFSVMDLLDTLQLLLFCRTVNCCAGHVAVLRCAVMRVRKHQGKMISKRVPAETTRLGHESWISMLVLTSFMWWTNTVRLFPSNTLRR